MCWAMWCNSRRAVRQECPPLPGTCGVNPADQGAAAAAYNRVDRATQLYAAGTAGEARQGGAAMHTVLLLGAGEDRPDDCPALAARGTTRSAWATSIPWPWPGCGDGRRGNRVPGRRARRRKLPPRCGVAERDLGPVLPPESPRGPSGLGRRGQLFRSDRGRADRGRDPPPGPRRPAGQIFMPQCGLAPGFVSILARHLAGAFDGSTPFTCTSGPCPSFPPTP